MRRLLAALLLAAACPLAARACTLRADLPLTTERGFLSVPARIDGIQITLLVDTGAEATLVTPALVAALGLVPDPVGRTTIAGPGGLLTTQNAWIHDFRIGTLQMWDQSVSVAPLPNLGGAPTQAAGLLGTDILARFAVELDLPGGHLRLWQAGSCAPGERWAGPHSTLPFALYGAGLVLLPATLDGHALRAMLDSGSNLTTLAEQAASAIPHTPSGEPAIHTAGVDGAILTTRLQDFTVLDVAGQHLFRPRLSVSPLGFAGADLLLGADWLHHRRVWIDYAARRIAVQPG